MDRNTILAIILSVGVMLLWGMYEQQYAPPARPPATASEPEAPAPVAPTEASGELAPLPPSEPAPAPAEAPAASVAEKISHFEKPLYIAEFTNRGGALQHWQLRGYDTGKREGSEPIEITPEDPSLGPALLTPLTELGLGDLSGATFEIEREDASGVQYRDSRNGVTLRKIYTLVEDSYVFRLRIQVENSGAESVSPEFGIRWPASVRDSQDFNAESFVWLDGDGVSRHAVAGIGSPGFFGSFFGGGSTAPASQGAGVDWAGIDTTYFLGILLPDNPAQAQVAVTPTSVGKAGVAELRFAPVAIPPGQITVQEFRAYLGPKEPERLEVLGGETIRAIDLGWSWIQPLVLAFGWLLQALYSVIPNYGWAIIVLTILVRVVTMPLTNKQMRSMERMRELQPKLKQLQEKYGDDRQKQSEEMMKLYRSEGVNPLGGCFPMILQLPVFIGLFYALRSSIQLRQAPFVGWIHDLSAPETLFTIPGLDLPVRVLPLVMGVSMVAQQKLTPQTAMDPAQAKMMMTIMPIMMTVLFYQFPSGLVLYWFVSNLLAIGHQLLIGRQMRAGS